MKQAMDMDPGLVEVKHRKKGGKRSLASLSRKHILDRMGQDMKEMVAASGRLIKNGIPKAYRASACTVHGDYYFALWACDNIDRATDNLDECFEEIINRK